MSHTSALALAGSAVLAIAMTATPIEAPTATEKLQAELRSVEADFARTMAERDHSGFEGFLASDVVFFSGDEPIRGSEAVSRAWAPYFAGEAAPFSWNPEVVVVLESGDLGLTSGPVRNAAGEHIGSFNSIWRRYPDGRWRIVFDRGCAPAK